MRLKASAVSFSILTGFACKIEEAGTDRRGAL